MALRAGVTDVDDRFVVDRRRRSTVYGAEEYTRRRGSGHGRYHPISCGYALLSFLGRGCPHIHSIAAQRAVGKDDIFVGVDRWRQSTEYSGDE